MTRREAAFYSAAALVLASMAGGVARIVYLWQHATPPPVASTAGGSPSTADGTMPVRLGREARLNLGISAKPLALTNYWRKVEIPAIVVDRPGISDRGVVAPATGVVTKIHAYPGDTISPDAPLFTLRLVSELLHASQLELFKATKEIEIGKAQKRRLESLAETGAVPGSRMIEIENQIERMEVTVQAYRQDLLARGLTPDRIDAAARGEFITEITVHAPGEKALLAAQIIPVSAPAGPPQLPFSYEMHTLAVELGQQVTAGEVLCQLADHRSLLIEGSGFKKDLPRIQQAAKQGLPVEVTFEQDTAGDWPTLATAFHIQHVANLIDPEDRTFAFYLPLENQWEAYGRGGKDHLIWRFRPGDRARLSVAVEALKDVYVLPPAAVVRDGADAFVFRQNGELFDRRPVHVLYEDTTAIVIASDNASLRPGFYIAQSAAAALNRVLKAQMASGVPTNLHVHADGTVHEAH